MIGTPLRGRATHKTATLIWVLCAGAFLVMAGIYHDVISPHLVMLGLLPACMAWAYWSTRRLAFQGELLTEGIATNISGQELVPYASIIALQLEAPAQRYSALHVHHSGGVLSIPPQSKTVTNDLRKFLLAYVPESSAQALPKDMQPIYQNHVGKFGAEKVFVYTPRLRQVKGFRGNSARAFFLGITFTGLFWVIGGIVGGASLDNFNGSGWATAGFVMALFGFLIACMASDHRSMLGGQKKWLQSGIIISPIGLALIQGKLRGEMKWDELKRLIYPIKRTSFESGNIRSGSIRLDLGGGRIDIFDIYSHPLDSVHERIKAYWRG